MAQERYFNDISDQAPNGWRYRRLGRNNSRNGKLPKFRNKPQKRAQSQPSGARCVGQFFLAQGLVVDAKKLTEGLKGLTSVCIRRLSQNKLPYFCLGIFSSDVIKYWIEKE